MILYSSNAEEFKHDVETNQIKEKILEAFLDRMGYLPGLSEQHAWGNSMQFMERIIRNAQIPGDCGILIEFNIPTTSKRIDFLVTGQDTARRDNFVIVELKQWEEAEATQQSDVVMAFTGGRKQNLTHPSYQAWSYKQFLVDMNESIHEGDFNGHACAYLHNYTKKVNEPLLLPQYLDIIKEAPIFFKDDYQVLQNYLYRQVCLGKGINTLYLIENGKLRPSRKLMDHVGGLFSGNDMFILLDEQKVVFETILEKAMDTSKKTVILVEGGPGTGKSVISMNIFGHLLQRRKNVRFVAPNAAFRLVMIDHLTRQQPRSRARIMNLFNGSGVFWDAPANSYDVLVVDEAHRLKNQKAYMYKGKNQVDDVIRAARVSVLFIDDNQQVRPDDIGSSREIRRLAAQYNADFIELQLTAQFRCAGADGFINWITDVLQIEQTGNFEGWDTDGFSFKLLESPHDLFNEIKNRENEGFKARLLAGYAWDWTSDKNGNDCGQVPDVVIDEYNFRMPWNPHSNRELWAVRSDGLNFIGCIHTSQGLEFDYVGVIFGNDLKYDPETGTVWADAVEYKDAAGKKGLIQNKQELCRLVKNIYKVLCSRGLKGCYVYCRDYNLQEYMKRRLRSLYKQSKD
jgi:uncharacterized protein